MYHYNNQSNFFLFLQKSIFYVLTRDSDSLNFNFVTSEMSNYKKTYPYCNYSFVAGCFNVTNYNLFIMRMEKEQVENSHNIIVPLSDV